MDAALAEGSHHPLLEKPPPRCPQLPPPALTPKVAEFCWGTPPDNLQPPYDIVVACDCVYAERLVDALVSSMVSVSGRSTSLMVASERREEHTYSKFRQRLAQDFTVRQAPRRQMNKDYDHENSEVLLCKLRRAASGKGSDKKGLGQEAVGGGTREGGGGERAGKPTGKTTAVEARVGGSGVAGGCGSGAEPGMGNRETGRVVQEETLEAPDGKLGVGLAEERGEPQCSGSSISRSPGPGAGGLDDPAVELSLAGIDLGCSQAHDTLP